MNFNISNLLLKLDNVIGYKFAFGTCIENSIGFSPAIWNKQYFQKIVIDALKNNQTTDKDPETIVREYYNTLKLDVEMHCLKNDLFAIDLGRSWARTIGLIKWSRRKEKETTEYLFN